LRAQAHNCDPWHGKCRNSPGSFQCYCDIGYQGDGVECHGCDDHERVVTNMAPPPPFPVLTGQVSSLPSY